MDREKCIRLILGRDHFHRLIPSQTPIYHKYPANIYFFKVSSINTNKRCKICLKLTIKIPEQCQSRLSGVFAVNFEHVSRLFLVSLLLTLNKKMSAVCLTKLYLQYLWSGKSRAFEFLTSAKGNF